MTRYILDGHKPVFCEDVLAWARWMEDADRTVAKTNVEHRTVSTVFLGLDHSMVDAHHGPVLFETMVFNVPHRQAVLDHWKTHGFLCVDPMPPTCEDPWNEWGERHAGSWEQAEEGHRRIVAALKAHPDQPPNGENFPGQED